MAAVVKDIDSKQGIVSGYFSAFGNRDSDGDIIMKGAYSKTIKERGPESSKPRIFHLWQHDSYKPLAKPIELNEDDMGLAFKTKISQTSWGRDVLQLYEDQVITEHSVGINILKTERVDEESQRVLEVKMWEGSSVTWGANERTPTIGGVKSLEAQDPEALIKRMDLLGKTMRKGNMTDETYQLIELEYEQIKTTIKSLLDKAMEPGGEDPTPAKSEQPTEKQISELLLTFKRKLKL